jgi:DNA-binding transcriptional MerR regulator
MNQLKFYQIAHLLRYNREKKLVSIKNTSKIYEAFKLLIPKFDELKRRYYTTNDLVEIQKIRSYRAPNQKYKVTEICKELKTTRQTLYTKMSFNNKLKGLIKNRENYKHLNEIREQFMLKRTEIKKLVYAY